MTFYRTCIYICIGLIVFNFSVIFIDGLGAFDTVGVDVLQVGDNTNDALANLTDFEPGEDDEYINEAGDPSMAWFWGVIIAGSGAGLIVAFFTKQIAPTGAIIFGTVFWASFVKTWFVLDVNGIISSNLPGFLIIFSVSCMFLFIAAVIGMFTGSG